MNIGMNVGQMDDLGRMDSPVHRLDARVKILVTGLFIGCVLSFPRYAVSALTPFFLYPLLLMTLGRIPPGSLLKKILIAAPFAVAVGLFNPLLDRRPLAMCGPIAISGGWISFASILLRFALTVSAALTLVACTGMHRLGAGLARLGAPRVFVVQLLFLYRYLFVLGDEGARMARGVTLRAAHPRALRFRVYASLMGHLLLRALNRAERVYRAMLARGFDGTIRVTRPDRLHGRDLLFAAGWAAFFVAARVWNLADLLGRLFLKGFS